MLILLFFSVLAASKDIYPDDIFAQLDKNTVNEVTKLLLENAWIAEVENKKRVCVNFYSESSLFNRIGENTSARKILKFRGFKVKDHKYGTPGKDCFSACYSTSVCAERGKNK